MNNGKPVAAETWGGEEALAEKGSRLTTARRFPET
jgi:hypothetical protein